MFIHKNTYSIGGLNEVGFAPAGDEMLVLSSQGEGIFNGLTGERIARRSNDYEWWQRFNEHDNTITGFDLLSDTVIPVSGLTAGDFLQKETADGWLLYVTPPEPDDAPFENYLVQKIYLKNHNNLETVFIAKDGPCELRAFGFSDTGKSLVVALSCEIIIYSR